MPATIHYLLPVSSFTFGTIFICSIVIVVFPRTAKNEIFYFGSQEKSLGALVAFIFVHGIFAGFLNQIDYLRFLGSVFGLVVLLRAAVIVGPYLFVPNLMSGAKVVFFTFLGLIVLSIVGVSIPGVNATAKAIFPFAEPSFFGLAFIPFLLYMVVISEKRTQYFYMFVGLVTALVLENLTLLCGVILIVLIAFSFSRIIVVSIAVLGFVNITGLDLLYYSSRLDFSDGNMNLSSLVYLQGWQMMAESLNASWGFGLGLQQLGLKGSNVDAAQLLYSITGDYLNLTDGSFVLSRLISDFGIFGIFGVLCYLKLVAQSFWMIRHFSFNKSGLHHGQVFAHSIVVISIIEVFVRGIGYLTGSVALFTSAVMFIYFSEKTTLHSNKSKRPVITP
jgi:hypothetical protein